MSQSQLRESASVFPHRVFSGVCAVFWRFCQCLDSQIFVLFCRPDEASPDYEKGFSGQPKSLFRAVIRCFLLCGGDVSGMRESLSDSAGKCFQCSGCIIIRILYTSDSFSVPVLRKYFVMIFYCQQMYGYAMAHNGGRCGMTEFLIAEAWERGAGEDVIEDDIRCFKSRDAIFCVSQGRICIYCQWRYSWVYCYGLLVRRKILRLYWAYAIE